MFKPLTNSNVDLIDLAIIVYMSDGLTMKEIARRVSLTMPAITHRKHKIHDAIPDIMIKKNYRGKGIYILTKKGFQSGQNIKQTLNILLRLWD